MPDYELAEDVFLLSNVSLSCASLLILFSSYDTYCFSERLCEIVKLGLLPVNLSANCSDKLAYCLLSWTWSTSFTAISQKKHKAAYNIRSQEVLPGKDSPE